MTWAVRFEDVSKRYQGGGPRYASLRDVLVQFGRRTVAGLRGGTVEPRGIRALDRVSFEVEEGEAFALIGPNGAGKTTALKLLTRISYPTGGRVRVRGRVAALIEVGAGIHPELTGRENIWLYGRIMGMSRQEITRRFDEIVDFAELGHVLDTPVKMYSSGMQLRLGFSIASHLDPDIFVVDEALAVGDAGFQAKCVERMTKLVSEGRTLLFVSHNLPAVESLCSRGLYLRDGHVAAIGSARDVLRRYLDWTEHQALERWRTHPRESDSSALVEIVAASCHDTAGDERYEFDSDDGLEVRVRFRSRQPIRNPHFSVGITDGRPGLLIHCSTIESGDTLEYVASEWTTTCRIEKLSLMPRLYHVWCNAYTAQAYGEFVEWQEVTAFRVVGRGEGKQAIMLEALEGAVKVDYRWMHVVGSHDDA